MNGPISPSFPNGFTCTRTAADVLRARLPARPAIPQTQFIIMARWPRDIRLSTIEHDLIETAAEALEAVKQNDDVVQVIRVDNDCAPRDVSEDIARAWLTEWIDAGGNPEEDDMPAFIEAHIGREDAIAIFAECYPVLEGAL